MTQPVIAEAMLYQTEPAECAICGRQTKYFDKLVGGDISCISCSYINKHLVDQETQFHTARFSPEDPWFLQESMRVSEHDVSFETATGKTQIVKVKLSAGSILQVSRFARAVELPPHVIMETALSLFLSMTAATMKEKEAGPQVDRESASARGSVRMLSEEELEEQP